LCNRRGIDYEFILGDGPLYGMVESIKLVGAAKEPQENFEQNDADDDHVRAAIIGEMKLLHGKKLRKFLRYVLEEQDDNEDQQP
jgi:hypothetical protein